MVPPTIAELEEMLGQKFFQHQFEALEDVVEQHQKGLVRTCLYHRTGAGKTRTALAAIRLTGATDVLVLAPPVTAPKWIADGKEMGLEVTVISHAKFRQKDYRVRRDQAMIVDEFHLLGGHSGKGWRKLDAMARGLQAPLVIGSATPNYNDAERVYCIQHVLAPHTCKGGYIQFLYDHCITTVNPFGVMPLVEGFRKYETAEEYLRDLPFVHYVEDEIIKQASITDMEFDIPISPWFEKVGFDERRQRICASQIEKFHARVRHKILDDDGFVRDEVYECLSYLTGQVATPTLVFLVHSEIAEALHRTCLAHGAKSLLVTGKDTYNDKTDTIERFKRGEADILIGTATLATGTDGIDKMCNQLVIVDDTNDDALRRQLMGRILPRGADSDVSHKVFVRFLYP